eukprot:jgi/Psemu1/35517/gm1.35517_g
MVPPPEAYDWSNVYGIAFKFQSDNNPQQVLSLNGSYAETVPLTAPEISTLFTSDANDKGPRTLGPAPVTALRDAFCNSITLDMANTDELAKGHIAQLLDSCPVRFVKPGSSNQRIRTPQDFDSAGREAVRRAEATNDPEPLATVLFNINRWKFKRNWKTDDPANYFNGIYTYNNDIPTDTNKCAVVPTPHSSGPSASPITNILTVPIQPVESTAHTTIPAPSYCVTSSSATTDLPPITLIDSDVVTIPSNTTTSVPPVTANFGPLQPVGPIADTPSVNAPCYIWTWTYSPQSESVSFRRVRSGSISFQRVTSSSPPIQRQDKPSTVIAPSISPSALTRFGHHSVLPSVPTNFGWTFNPQNEIATFRRLPESALSPQPPMCNRLLPSEAIAEGTDLSNAAPAYNRSLQSPYYNQIGSKPQPVLRLSKRHRDALKIKMYHLYANILSMNWFYDTVRRFDLDLPLDRCLQFILVNLPDHTIDPRLRSYCVLLFDQSPAHVHIKSDLIEPGLLPINHRFSDPDDLRLLPLQSLVKPTIRKADLPVSSKLCSIIGHPTVSNSISINSSDTVHSVSTTCLAYLQLDLRLPRYYLLHTTTLYPDLVPRRPQYSS